MYCLMNTTASVCLPSAFMFLTLIIANLFVNSSNSNLNQKPDPKKYDSIIVRADTAGSVLANRLTEISHWNVLLLETGVEKPKVAEVPVFIPMFAGSNIFHNYQLEREENSCQSKPCSTKVGKEEEWIVKLTI